MSIRPTLSLASAAMMAALLTGCCCPCGFISTGTGGGGLGGPARVVDESDDFDTGISDEEFNDGWNYAQQALTNVGYGDIQDATVTADGNKRTVSGTAEGLTGSTVNYEVRFDVLVAGTTYNWVVKKVLIDGDTVYDKP